MLSYLIFFFLSIFSFSFKCGHDKIKKIPKIANDSLIENNKRRLDDTYHSISFFVDYTQLDRDSADSTYKNFLKSAIESTLKIFSELIKVKRTKNLVFKNPAECSDKITYFNNQITTGVDRDIILFPIIDRTLESGVDAAASACYVEPTTYRPTMGFVLLNQNYAYTKTNAKDFLTMLLLHEITHVLVFSESLYSYFNYKGDVTTTSTINGISRTLIKTPKVRSIAAQHFNCSSIVGVEIENQGGKGSAGSHWEGRVMLGDYMISTDYLEIVISDISLALFEDSGWYQVNYYTGGLFRFGKGQGCNFLNSPCVSSGRSNFELDFCDTSNNLCSVNNIFRGFCYLKEYTSSLPSSYQYFENKKIGGWEPADYCPVPIESSSNTYYFKSSCIYGETSTVENNYPSSLGFSISNNSICFQSSLVSSSDISLKDYAFKRSMCHQILCNYTSKTIIVDIGTSRINCPTNGGEMEVDGYNGTILCPPFNRVCTSTTYTGNPIEAALNHIVNSDIDYSYILPDVENNVNTDEIYDYDSHRFLEIGLYKYILLLFLYFIN